MRILQVSENYSAGGLEKFVTCFSEELVKQGHESFLALGNLRCSDSRPAFQTAIFEDFHFGKNASETNSELIADIDRLCEIIQEHSIDFMIIHPFFSFFPAIAASKIMEVPTSYVIHGTRSCTFPIGPVDNALFRVALDISVDHVFTTQEWFRKLVHPSIPSSILRNPIPIDFDMRSDDSALLMTKSWTLCSRLDADKRDSIINLLSWMNDLEIEHLDIFGEGTCQAELAEYADSNGLNGKIAWHGFNDHWLSFAMEHNAGVIGLGRVAIESLSANLPVILLGVEGGICGVVDRHLFDLSKDSNFGRMGIATLDDPKQLKSQLSDYYANPAIYLLGEETRKDFAASEAVRKCVGVYESLIREAGLKKVSAWKDFVDSLRIAPEQNTPFVISPTFAYLLKECFLLFSPVAEARNSLISAELWADGVISDMESNDRDQSIISDQASRKQDIDSQQETIDEMDRKLEDTVETIARLQSSKPFRLWSAISRRKQRVMDALRPRKEI